MSNSLELVKFLELASQRLRHHHNALWEEEKHYTWWIYVIFAGLIFLYVQSLVPWQKIILIAFGSLFGFLSLIGLFVVRKEGEYFHEATQIHDRTIVALGLNQPKIPPSSIWPISLMPPVEKRDWKIVKSEANKQWCELIAGLFRLVTSPFRSRREELGIRDYFQVVFLAAAILFVVFFAFSLVTFFIDP